MQHREHVSVTATCILETYVHEWWYMYLEHGPDVVHVRGAGEGGAHVTDRLHQRLGRLRHVVHLDGVELLPLPLARHRHACSHKHVRDVRAPSIALHLVYRSRRT